jgi:hypothetical protein
VKWNLHGGETKESHDISVGVRQGQSKSLLAGNTIVTMIKMKIIRRTSSSNKTNWFGEWGAVIVEESGQWRTCPVRSFKAMSA